MELLLCLHIKLMSILHQEQIYMYMIILDIQYHQKVTGHPMIPHVNIQLSVE